MREHVVVPVMTAAIWKDRSLCYAVMVSLCTSSRAHQGALLHTVLSSPTELALLLPQRALLLITSYVRSISVRRCGKMFSEGHSDAGNVKVKVVFLDKLPSCRVPIFV